MAYKSPIKDEIPGMTSFLYEANRSREEHEFTNFWKWISPAEKKAKELGVNLGDIMELLFKIEDLQRELASKEDLNSDLWDKKEKLINYMRHLEDEYINLNSQYEDLTHDSNIMESQRQEALYLLFQFGDHKPDCGWLEVVESGRALNIDERSECTCGWCALRDKISSNPENLDAIQKSTNKEDPLNGKPVKELRDLDIE